MQSNPTYRVVQWSTGTIGVRALRAVVEHPDLTLAGVYVHGKDKVGRDVGELCGVPPVGVTATDDVEEVVSSGADCVLYMPNAPGVGALVGMLAAGINVVTTCGLFHHPIRWILQSGNVFRTRATRRSIHPQHRQRPGLITEAVPLV